jgi:hypothetical protein
MPQEWGAMLVRNAEFLFGCNNIFRRAAVPDAGGYDESMRTSGEDGELSRQLYAKRWELIYDREAQATHLRSDSLQSFCNYSVAICGRVASDSFLLLYSFSPAFLVVIFGCGPRMGNY